jgi:hypothetical protein
MKTGRFTLKQTVAMFQAMGDGDDSEISSLSDSDDNEETFVGDVTEDKPLPKPSSESKPRSSVKGPKPAPWGKEPKQGPSKKAATPGSYSKVSNSRSNIKNTQPTSSNKQPKSKEAKQVPSCTSEKPGPRIQKPDDTSKYSQRADVEPDSDGSATDDYDFDKNPKENVSTAKASCRDKKNQVKKAKAGVIDNLAKTRLIQNGKEMLL